MLCLFTVNDALYPALMLLLALVSFIFNVLLARRSNNRFKREEMDKKLDVEDFKTYKFDHTQIHERDRVDVLYIRKSVDEIKNHLMKTKK